MSSHACLVDSPLPYPKTMPLAMTTGSPRCMSREIQAGVSWSLPPRSSTLNAATPPSFVSGVFMIGKSARECAGPQNGASTQRVPLPSSHVDTAPQLPASWKSTSSLQKSGVLKSGV